MSSTNRSNAREGHISDFYVTPKHEIMKFFGELICDYPEILMDSQTFLDPCAGGSSEFGMSYPEVLKSMFNINTATADIREDSLASIKSNYLELNCKNEYDVIITNPPFNKALEIITKALDDVRENGYVIMLLRLNFFASQTRYPFFQQQMPKLCYVHSKRMSFLPKEPNKTDSIEYAHFVFQKGYTERFTELRILPFG